MRKLILLMSIVSRTSNWLVEKPKNLQKKKQSCLSTITKLCTSNHNYARYDATFAVSAYIFEYGCWVRLPRGG